MRRSVVCGLAGGLAAMAAMPAFAQDHHAHALQGDLEPAPALPPAPAPADADPMAGMEHGAVFARSPGPEMETPPPPEAGNSPPRAADGIWGAEAMRASRRDLQQTHGSYPLLWVMVDRLEAQARKNADTYLWELQGYLGGPTSRFWFKSEGQGSSGKRIEDAEIQALYSRAIAPFFDVQVGVRQDVAGPATTHAVLGIQGLVPYMFEIDAAVFLSHRGDLTARLEAELEQKITQRLIVQPRAELNLAAQDVPQLGMGAGLDSIEIGVRLRYEFRREFAPYVGVEQQWRTGRGADFARAAGDNPNVTRFVAGIRLWF